MAQDTDSMSYRLDVDTDQGRQNVDDFGRHTKDAMNDINRQSDEAAKSMSRFNSAAVDSSRTLSNMSMRSLLNDVRMVIAEIQKFHNKSTDLVDNSIGGLLTQIGGESAKWAAILSKFGPWGTAIGAVGGLAYGAFKSKTNYEEAIQNQLTASGNMSTDTEKAVQDAKIKAANDAQFANASIPQKIALLAARNAKLQEHADNIRSNIEDAQLAALFNNTQLDISNQASQEKERLDSVNQILENEKQITELRKQQDELTKQGNKAWHDYVDPKLDKLHQSSINANSYATVASDRLSAMGAFSTKNVSDLTGFNSAGYGDELYFQKQNEILEKGNKIAEDIKRGLKPQNTFQ